MDVDEKVLEIGMKFMEKHDNALKQLAAIEREELKNEKVLDKSAFKVSQILRIFVEDIDKAKFVYMYTLLYNQMGQGPDGKPCEEGDENMRHWLNTYNTHLGFCPADELVNKMPEIIGYLESFL